MERKVTDHTGHGGSNGYAMGEVNEGNHRATLPATYLEPAPGDAPLATEALPGFDSPVTIRVISYRKRNHDPDGISAKAVLDGLVRAGILTDDSSKQVRSITFESRKADEERTLIIMDDDIG